MVNISDNQTVYLSVALITKKKDNEVTRFMIELKDDWMASG